jgi:prophage regulatory protein
MQKRVLSYLELRHRKGIAWSRAHVYRMVNAGKFPRPIKLGEATTAWLEEEVDSWLAQRVAERDNAP